MIRSVEQWSEIINRMAGKPLNEIAARILGDLTHYYHGRSHEQEDRNQLGNALLAFADVFGPDREDTPPSRQRKFPSLR